MQNDSKCDSFGKSIKSNHIKHEPINSNQSFSEINKNEESKSKVANSHHDPNESGLEEIGVPKSEFLKDRNFDSKRISNHL